MCKISVSIDRSVVVALLSTTPRVWSQVVYERSLVSRSTGGSKLDGDGKIPPVADVKSVGPFAHAAAYATTTRRNRGTEKWGRRQETSDRSPPAAATSDKDDRYGGLQRNEKRRLSKYRGYTGRGSGLEAFSRYRAEAAWHRRSFMRAREPLLRSRCSLDGLHPYY